MSTIIHMSMNITGALKRTDRQLNGLFEDEKGHPLTDAQARKFLLQCRAKGWRLFPVGDCPNFNHQTGCPGHIKS